MRFVTGRADAGSARMLDSVVAVVIGGASLYGETGNMIGSIIGTLVIGVLETGMVNLGLPTHNKYVYVGVILAGSSHRSILSGDGEKGSVMAMNELKPLLEVRNIVKRFGGLVALNRVNMEVYPKEAVRLLGDNGVGKSTLIKIVSGGYRADEGEIFFNGKEVKISSPMEALKLGIETIYQDLALAESLNVYSNIFLGREKLEKAMGLIPVLDYDSMLQESRKVLNRLGIEIPSLKSKIKKSL